ADRVGRPEGRGGDVGDQGFDRLGGRYGGWPPLFPHGGDAGGGASAEGGVLNVVGGRLGGGQRPLDPASVTGCGNGHRFGEGQAGRCRESGEPGRDIQRNGGELDRG